MLVLNKMGEIVSCFFFKSPINEEIQEIQEIEDMFIFKIKLTRMHQIFKEID